MKRISIKEYGRTELALLYSPGLTSHGAWLKLRRWIEMKPGMMQRMTAAGYKKNSRSFPPAIVRIIFEELGEP